MRIGVCGTGKMGGAIAGRLIDLGHEVVVWNRTAGRLAPLLAAGATAAPSPAALAGEAGTIISMLLDDAASDGVYRGPSGLLSGDLRDRLVIDMSTVLPETAAGLARDVAAAGGLFVDCPVGGTVTPAREGKLLGMAGGTAEAYARAHPLLERLCRRVDHVGPAGSGATMKLAINLPLAVYWEALGEALSLAARAGIDLKLAGDILADSSGAIAVAKPRIPMVLQAIEAAPASGAAFDLSAMTKDLSLMVRHAAQRGMTVPAAQVALDSYKAASAEGWAARDAALLAAWRFLANAGKG